MGVDIFAIPELGANNPGVKRLFIEYTSGATGAIPTTLTRAQGLSSIARTGTGVVDFVFSNPVYAIVSWNMNVEQASVSNTGACEYTGARASDGTKLTITFRKNSDFTAVDTADGDKVILRVDVMTVQP